MGYEVSRLAPFSVCSLPPACGSNSELPAALADVILFAVTDSDPLDSKPTYMLSFMSAFDHGVLAQQENLQDS